jgi:hypothetical protein
MNYVKILLFLGIVALSQSCTVLKEYEKVYINDEEMALVGKSLERFEMNFQVYREAAAGANGGKTGGGCGCN